jgi:hypothetical protein
MPKYNVENQELLSPLLTNSKHKHISFTLKTKLRKQKNTLTLLVKLKKKKIKAKMHAYIPQDGFESIQYSKP